MALQAVWFSKKLHEAAVSRNAPSLIIAYRQDMTAAYVMNAITHDNDPPPRGPGADDYRRVAGGGDFVQLVNAAGTLTSYGEVYAARKRLPPTYAALLASTVNYAMVTGQDPAVSAAAPDSQKPAASAGRRADPLSTATKLPDRSYYYGKPSIKKKFTYDP